MRIDPTASQQRYQADPEGVAALTELALNLHWTWNHAADELWKRLDAGLWQDTQNPWVILQTVSQDTITAALAEPEFRGRLDTIRKKDAMSYRADAWFQKKHTSDTPITIAYFSMEFMLSEALPIYSGGLGQVAGDQMKAASDLGVPVVGIGLLYGQGYFRQDFDAEGRQQVLYPVNDPGQLPIKPLRQENGEWLRLPIKLPGSILWLRCWEVSVGRLKLYLLDTNDFANTAAQRGICSQLYGGDAEIRLRQELVLGIGGWRLLRALGLKPEVCHLNEGHAAFAVLERARSYMADYKVSFAVALSVTRAGNMFTTHTAVTAGFDRFAPELIRKYLTHYAQDELGLGMEEFFALGRQNTQDSSEPFNMAYLAVHGSGQVSGVSKLHGQVSRQIFQPLFPHWPQVEVPIGSVTNGVHVPTWDSEGADALWTAACGKDRWRGEEPDEAGISEVTDQRLWDMRTQGRKALIDHTRERYARQLAGQDWRPGKTDGILAEGALTMAFARRFATYNRPNLLLHDPERLVRLLSNRERPIQLILAGKAHPLDLPGQALVKQWNDFIRRDEVSSHVVFLIDYDMRLAQELVEGVDLWINTPRRPWEACGTSGMKILANGGLNLSELDGWWAEAYAPEIGWAIGDGKEPGEDPGTDAAEAEAMYGLLEREIVPEFYERTPGGLPVKWLSRVRESMARLTPAFSASRAIRDYTEDHYLPAASAYQARRRDDNKLGVELVQWQEGLSQHWRSLQFGPVTVNTQDGRHRFCIAVLLGGVLTNSVRIEMFANSEQETMPETHLMTPCESPSPSPGSQMYVVEIPATRPASDYTARAIPQHADAFVPLEAAAILWQH
jgi:starch phosphorylase